MQPEAIAQRLTEVLGLRSSPVAVIYTDEEVADAVRDPVRVCTALKQAAGGATLDVALQNSACPGGSYYLGLSDRSPSRLPPVRKFLIEGEKIFADAVALHRALHLTDAKPPTKLADHVVFAPLARAPLEPDLVVFICDCNQAARLVALCYYFDGLPMHCDPTGSLCSSVITYPLVTGRINVSLGDVAARRMEKFGPDQLFVSVPWERMGMVAAAIDRSSAGTAKMEIPEAMLRGRRTRPH